MKDVEKQYRQRYKRTLKPIAGRLKTFLESCLASEPRIDRITTRAKSVDRFMAKATRIVSGQRKYSDPINQIQDQVGARIVTFYTDDVPRVAKAVEKYLNPIESKVVVPDSEAEFGYFGYHYIMLLPKEALAPGDDKIIPFFELQVQTLFQHAWSEANHDLGYKTESELSASKKRRIAFTSAQAWGADWIFNELHGESGQWT